MIKVQTVPVNIFEADLILNAKVMGRNENIVMKGSLKSQDITLFNNYCFLGWFCNRFLNFALWLLSFVHTGIKTA